MGASAILQWLTRRSRAPADLLIFAVKATGLEEAIQTVRNKVSDNTIIMSVLNGISSEDIIGRVYGMDKIIHCIVNHGYNKDRNQVKYSQFGHICLGMMKKMKIRKEG